MPEGICDRCGRYSYHITRCVDWPKNFENFQMGQSARVRGVYLCLPCYNNHLDDPDVREQMCAVVVDADAEPVYGLPDPEPYSDVEVYAEEEEVYEEKRPWWKFW